MGRLRACFSTTAYPYERKVCLVAYRIRTLHMAAGVIVLTAPVWVWWSRQVTVLETVLGAPAARAVLLVCGAWLLWEGIYLGGFVWADLGGEERFRELATGNAVNPNMFPTCTMEGYEGHVRGGYAEDDVNATAYHDDKFFPLRRPNGGPARYRGEPGSGRYDVFAPDEETWATKLHHRHVRPRLIRRGVPGYEMLT